MEAFLEQLPDICVGLTPLIPEVVFTSWLFPQICFPVSVNPWFLRPLCTLWAILITLATYAVLVYLIFAYAHFYLSIIFVGTYLGLQDPLNIPDSNHFMYYLPVTLSTLLGFIAHGLIISYFSIVSLIFTHLEPALYMAIWARAIFKDLGGSPWNPAKIYMFFIVNVMYLTHHFMRTILKSCTLEHEILFNFFDSLCRLLFYFLRYFVFGRTVTMA